MTDKVTVRMTSGDLRQLEACGVIPPHKGQHAIIVRNEDSSCFAARLTPTGYVLIEEPVRLFPVT